jgi:hypothetical protein
LHSPPNASSTSTTTVDTLLPTTAFLEAGSHVSIAVMLMSIEKIGRSIKRDMASDGYVIFARSCFILRGIGTGI